MIRVSNAMKASDRWILMSLSVSLRSSRMEDVTMSQSCPIESRTVFYVLRSFYFLVLDQQTD